MDKPFASRARNLRLKPLARCLALALAIGAGSAAAATNLAAADPANATMMQRLQGSTASGSEPPWSMAQRRQQVLLGDRHPAPHSPTPVPAGSPAVTNCNDDGPGSLRDTIDTVALSGDTIDLTHTGCSTITLTTGAIAIAQNDLTLQGPDSGALSIDGNYEFSPLRHSGSGTLSLSDIKVAHGLYFLDAAATTDAKGGCIYSAGTVAISGTEVTYCQLAAANPSYYAFGGAIYAQLGVSVSNSTITLGTVGFYGHPGRGGAIASVGTVTIDRSYIGGNYARFGGGGIWALAPAVLTVDYSTISNNRTGGAGGGLVATGSVLIDHSTLSGNSAGGGGAVFMMGLPDDTTPPARLLNSTVSGNSAQIGGGLLAGFNASIANSTIAFNTETRTHGDGTAYGAGLCNSGGTVELQSTLIANNMLVTDDGAVADDVGGNYTSVPSVLIGANNLIVIVASALTPPPDTLFVDPLLSPLFNNGGPTSTHALNAHSPAIAAGNNTAAQLNDQRGVGFPRSFGSATDIGAFQSHIDAIFADGFE